MFKKINAWLSKRKRNRLYGPDTQIQILRQILQEDLRWLGHDPLAEALIERYRDLAATDWEKRSLEHIHQFRYRIGLDPHYSKSVPLNMREKGE